MRLMSQKSYRMENYNKIKCARPNILKLGHQNYCKNTENRKIIVPVYTKKNTKHSSTN